MSHLSILPTVLRDAEVLATSLRSLGLNPLRSQSLPGFAGESVQVEVALKLDPELWIGWRREREGPLTLVGDLQRLSRHHHLPALLGRITRAYAAHQAVTDAARLLPEADLHLRV
ncbi:MAG: DUF1257 domain-containing protein [Synechococcaceae cyanobacterium]|jgi:hypothetical protein|nr:DUF1257 domain-containing protein [Synechococcaceae cyanobacterium]